MDETGDVSKDRLYDQWIKLTEKSIIQYLCHTTTKAAEAKINLGLQHIYDIYIYGTINIILNNTIFLRLLHSTTIT